MTLRDLPLDSIWVHPEHLASTALFIQTGHGVRVLPVWVQGKVVGVVRQDRLVGAPSGTQVFMVMEAEPAVLQASTPVRSAARTLSELGADFVVVLDGERLAGVITAPQLLGVLGKSYDPLTGLSWSDELREWGQSQLSAGHEISILFVDLDDFRDFNKAYGHVVGDHVLKVVADFLGSKIDPRRDLLVRYAGDEFAIGTTRRLEEAMRLAQAIAPPKGGLFVEGAHPVAYSVGVSGGRRAEIRSDIHVASTLDALINSASKKALEQKGQSAEASPIKIDEEEGTYKVVKVRLEMDREEPVGTVILSKERDIYSASVIMKHRTPEETVVLATLRALASANADLELQVDSLAVISMDDHTIVTLKGRGRRGSEEFPIDTQRRSIGSPLVAAAQTTVEVLTQGA